MSGIIVTFSFNNDYVSYGKLLCESILESGSDVDVFARCVNVDDNNINYFRSTYPSFTFYEDNINLNNLSIYLLF